jgi:hypothetical protein
MRSGGARVFPGLWLPPVRVPAPSNQALGGMERLQMKPISPIGMPEFKELAMKGCEYLTAEEGQLFR